MNMKNFKSTVKSFKSLLKNDKGQGTAEYVLLLAIVAGVLMMFGPQIKDAIKAKMDGITSNMQEIGK